MLCLDVTGKTFENSFKNWKQFQKVLFKGSCCMKESWGTGQQYQSLHLIFAGVMLSLPKKKWKSKSVWLIWNILTVFRCVNDWNEMDSRDSYIFWSSVGEV